jgi:hypothetical protein
MIAATYMVWISVWIFLRVLRDWLTEKLLIDVVAVAGLYFITKFFIERTV